MAAESTEAWLMALRERIAEVEEDAEEAFEKRRQLVRLLVERIDVGRDEYGSTQAHITYRFGPPEAQLQADILDGIRGSTSSTTTKKTIPAPASWPSSSPRTSAAWASVGL